MEQEFSTAWVSSKQPRKQRKYLANAPLHIRKKMFNANLSKELRKKHGKRSLPLRKGDTVKIMRGGFKGKTGKILSIRLKTGKIEIEGIQIKKKDGSKINVPIKHSNLQIIEMTTEDKKRNIKKTETKTENTMETKKTEKKTQTKTTSGGKK